LLRVEVTADTVVVTDLGDRGVVLGDKGTADDVVVDVGTTGDIGDRQVSVDVVDEVAEVLLLTRADRDGTRTTGVGHRSQDFAVAQDAATPRTVDRQITTQDGVDDVGVLGSVALRALADPTSADVHAADLGGHGTDGGIDDVDEA